MSCTPPPSLLREAKDIAHKLETMLSFMIINSESPSSWMLIKSVSFCLNREVLILPFWTGGKEIFSSHIQQKLNRRQSFPSIIGAGIDQKVDVELLLKSFIVKKDLSPVMQMMMVIVPLLVDRFSSASF